MSGMRNPSDKNKSGDDWRETTAEMSPGQRYLYLLEHGILTDCTFVVGLEDGETKQFKAHRFLLCNASPVFEKMLTGEMVEAKTGHVRVTDLSPDTFQLLLRLIYAGDEIVATLEEVRASAFAAHRYQVQPLLRKAVTNLCGTVSYENVWSVLEIAKLCRHTQLREACSEIVHRDTMKVLREENFSQLSEENVALLLEQDELNVEDELVLVKFTLYWARHEAWRRGLSGDDEGVRAVLQPRLLPLLRFFALTYQQFVTGPALAGWLTSREKNAIKICLHTKDFSRLPSHLSTAGPRKVPTGMLGHMERNKIHHSRQLNASNGVQRNEIVIDRYY